MPAQHLDPNMCFSNASSAFGTLLQEKEVPKSNDGQLSLKVIRAMDLQETGVLKYQDPFVVIESSRAKFGTETAKGAGSDPEWKAAFEFQVASGNAACHQNSFAPLLGQKCNSVYCVQVLTHKGVVTMLASPCMQCVFMGLESRVQVVKMLLLSL